MKKAIICFTRVPQAGKTKTRLMSFLSGEECAALHIAFLEDISEVLADYDADVFVAYTPEGDHSELQRIFPYAKEFFSQKGGELGEKMHNCLCHILDLGYDRCVLVGADLPLLGKEHFDSAFTALDTADVSIGPTLDGGYYLVGLKKPCAAMFTNQSYSCDSVFDSAVKAAESQGFTVKTALTCSDVDTADDLRSLVNSVEPDSHTAKLMGLLGLSDGLADGEETKFGGNLVEYFPFWELLNKGQKNRVKARCSKETLKKGTILFGNSEEHRGVMLLRSGAMRMYMVSNEGRELNTFHFGPGDICIFSATSVVPEIDFEILVEVMVDVQALTLRRDDFCAIIRENMALELFIYKLLTERYTKIVKFLGQVIFEKVDKRLAKYLLEEAEKGRGKNVLATHDHIACEIGSAREVVSKTLKRMAKEAIIKLSYNRIEILDAEALRQIADE